MVSLASKLSFSRKGRVKIKLRNRLVYPFQKSKHAMLSIYEKVNKKKPLKIVLNVVLNPLYFVNRVHVHEWGHRKNPSWGTLQSP